MILKKPQKHSLKETFVEALSLTKGEKNLNNC